MTLYDPLFDTPVIRRVKGIKGDQGLSAYEVATKNGFVGTEKDFLLSLKGKDGITEVIVKEIPAPPVKGDKGDKGDQGIKGDKGDSIEGKPGVDGKSAYQLWLSLGNRGSVEDFILSLRGDNGLSAYDIWLNNGYNGAEEDFLKWLKGKDGISTYQNVGMSVPDLAGQVGRLKHKDSTLDTDDLMIVRAGSLFRISVENLVGSLGFIPYTGATEDVDLGGNSIVASNLSGTNTGDQNLFSTIAVSGQSDVTPDSPIDTLTLVAGDNITITTDAATDSITINASSGGATLTEVEKDLGSFARTTGSFTITGLSGLTIGKPVIISQAAAAPTGKGTRADEVEMDMLTVSAVVTAADTITAYWNTPLFVKGNMKFNYFIGA